MARVSESRAKLNLVIFTRKMNDLCQKLIMHSKSVTDIHTMLAANPWSAVHNPMPHASALEQYNNNIVTND